MAITADRLVLDLSALPWHAERFGAGFYLGRGNNGKPLLLVAPGVHLDDPSGRQYTTGPTEYPI